MKKTALLLFIVFFSFQLTAQQSEDSRIKLRLLETQGDKYEPVDTRSMLRSPAYTYSSPGFFMIQVNTDEDGMNIVGDAANGIHDPDLVAAVI